MIEKLKKAVAAEKIVSSGDAQAQADLAEVYMFLGNSLEQAGPQKDYELAFDFAQKSAAQDNGDGIWVLALCYEHGRGVAEDKNKALEHYIRGAELGHAPSQHSYACYLFRGEIVKKDNKKAFELFMKSAEQGYGLAMADVGRCYQFGNGTMGNMKKAVEWYEKALEVIDDPELARKTALFKAMGAEDENWGEDYPGAADEIDEDDLPEGYMDALNAFAAEETSEKAEDPSAADNKERWSLTIFGTLSDVLMPVIKKARARMDANPDEKTVFFMESRGDEYEITVEDTDMPMTHVVNCKNGMDSVAR